jgi:cytochrome c oxidase subunit 2
MEGVTGSAIASPEAKELLQAKACGACHVIPGVKEAYGKAGPSLKGLHKRRRLVGGALENNLENLKAWLKNPESIKPGTLMPNTGLTDEEVEILIQYLNTI